MEYITTNYTEILTAITAVIAAASAVAALTPTPKDDSAILWVRKIIDFLALNILNAKKK